MSTRPPNKILTTGAAILMAAVACAAPTGGCAPDAPPKTSSSSVTEPVAATKPIEPTTVPVKIVIREVPRVEEPVAVVNGKPIERDQLVKPLVEAYGLNLLLQIIQLELARQDAAGAGLTVSPNDVTKERAIMLKGFFPDAEQGDYDQLLAQLLKQQNITPPQWQILLETNAHLRKMAEPLCAGKISEDNIKQAFDLQYGGLVKIRDIQVSNIAEAQEVKRRLADNEKFEDVARALSKDPRTAGLGGDWPAFSAKSTTVSDIIKQQAFTLKVGEVSDALNTEGVFHIIKVEERIPPKVAKLDASTHAYLLNALMEGFVQDTMKRLRNQLAQEALQPNIMQIRDPELKRQFDQKVAEHQAAAKEEEEARRLQATKRLLPATIPATQPAETAPGERPPATKSAAATRPATDPSDKKK